MPKSKKGGYAEAIKTAVYAAAIALVVRTFAYEPFNIPSGSMIPTLLVGDYLFVSKFSYGYSRHSLPFSLPLIEGRVAASTPERGDVVVFKLPSDDRTDYIKRVIGLPGDRVQVKDGILHINDVAVDRRRTDDFLMEQGPGIVARATQYIEVLPNGRNHRIIEMSDNGPFDDTPVYTVPEGHYFFMGDNRDRSSDSRFGEVGYVPAVNLVGRAEFIFFSIDDSVWKFWTWPSTIRFARLFEGIE